MHISHNRFLEGTNCSQKVNMYSRYNFSNHISGDCSGFTPKKSKPDLNSQVAKNNPKS